MRELLGIRCLGDQAQDRVLLSAEPEALFERSAYCRPLRSRWALSQPKANVAESLRYVTSRLFSWPQQEPPDLSR